MALRELMMISAVLLLAFVKFSTCALHLNGSVTCLDCHGLSDLSDIKVLVECSQVKKLVMATTTEDGTFETELPSDTPTSAAAPPSPDCLATILGGPSQLYSSRNNMASVIVKAPESESYTISAPLKFHTKCPLSSANCGAYTVNAEIDSSKTIDLPLPPEWGLAPSSYYVPFVPIIGIP